MDDPQDLISVYQAANMTEAYLVKNLLGDEGIEAQVSEENEPFAGLPIVPPDVLVKKMDEGRARAIVAQYEKEQEERRHHRGDVRIDDSEESLLKTCVNRCNYGLSGSKLFADALENENV